MSCNVCTTDFNKAVNIKITCFKCEFDCCRKCVKTYVLSKNENAHCMSCKIEWDRKFLTDNLDNVFMTKTYKEHREAVCFDRELGMLQGTQVYVEREIKLEALKKELKETKTLIAELKLKQADLEREILVENQTKVAVNKKFVRRCPNGDCLGFLSTSLKCDLCEVFACSECHEIKGKTTQEKESHQCKAEVIESVKMIEADSKACPTCSSLIFKIEGCHQMYCVCCHTAFDWQTLRIETGQIHNPEYFEYLRKKGSLERNQDEVLCGRELDHNLYLKVLARVSNENYIIQEQLQNIMEKAMHIRFDEQPRFRRDRVNDNIDLRIMYMRKQIDKDKFKMLLQKREKESSKSNEIHNVLVMFTNCLTEILYRVEPKTLRENINECDELRKYTNDCLTRISKTYKSKEYTINRLYNFI